MSRTPREGRGALRPEPFRAVFRASARLLRSLLRHREKLEREVVGLHARVGSVSGLVLLRIGARRFGTVRQ